MKEGPTGRVAAPPSRRDLRPVAAQDGHELGAGLRAGAEPAPHRRGDHRRPRLFDPPNRHAGVDRLDHHAAAVRLQPDGCGVVIEAVHTCMTIRGIEKPGTTMVTSAMRGGFRGRPETRAEFMTIVRGGPR